MENQYCQNLENCAFEVKVGLAEMLKGGIIVEVTSPEEARIAEEAGAIAVVAQSEASLDSDILGDVSRMTDPEIIQKIQEVVSIPVMAQCRIGHFVEAQILEALFVDFIIESETLSPADAEFHILKKNFKIPFACSCRDLAEALCRIGEGAALVRVRTEGVSGDVYNAVGALRKIAREVNKLKHMDPAELSAEARNIGAPYHLVEQVAKTGKLPVPLFAAGGIVTPADVALVMQLGAESVFVGADLFLSEDPLKVISALVAAATFSREPEVLAKVSMGLLSGEDSIIAAELATWT